MGNMGYCRFQNTLPDLQDCYDNWDRDDMSSEEGRAREQLLALCKDIVAEFGEE